MTYDLAILGGGPAGVSAGVYASRKQLKTVLITESFGGQSVESSGIENWIGTIKIPGPELAENLKKHLLAYAQDVVSVREGERITDVSKQNDIFIVKTDKGTYEARTVLVTTGSSRRKLEIPGASEFENRGITYCASCDGPLFSGKDVVVIGGGNAGFETAAQLLAYAKSVTLLNRSGEFKADPVTVKNVLAKSNMKAIMNATPLEVKGDTFVTSLTYEDALTKEKIELPAQGIFVEIGLIPSTDYIKNLAPTNQYGQIIIDPKTQKTNTPGIWAAGDCAEGLYHQNNIAAGDAVRALEDIYLSLHAK